MAACSRVNHTTRGRKVTALGNFESAAPTWPATPRRPLQEAVTNGRRVGRPGAPVIPGVGQGGKGILVDSRVVVATDAGWRGRSILHGLAAPGRGHRVGGGDRARWGTRLRGLLS